MIRLYTYVVTLALIVFLCDPVFAGWISIKNDTTQTVIVQETITINGQVRKLKPIKLAPGEVLREHQTTGGTKTVVVSQTGLFGSQLFSGELSWKTDMTFSIRKDGEKVVVSDSTTLLPKTAIPRAQAPSDAKPIEITKK